MREYLTVPLNLKTLENRQLSGHGSVFGNVDLGDDIVEPGAFARSLAEHEKAGSTPQMFWMHDPKLVPGKWLDMHEDRKGLAVTGELAKTQLGDEMRTLANMKAVRGLSIGFVPHPGGVDFDSDGHRLLKSVDLWEVSLVSLAMNPLAQIEASKARLSASGEYVPTIRQFERMMRECGLSQRVAKSIVKTAFDTEPRDVDRQRDVETEGISEVLQALGRETDTKLVAALRLSR